MPRFNFAVILIVEIYYTHDMANQLDSLKTQSYFTLALTLTFRKVKISFTHRLLVLNSM